MNMFCYFKKIANNFFLILLTFILVNCTQAQDPINYLGQKPPGLVAELFAPGIISTNSNEHSAIAFSADGSVVLWAIMDKNFRGRLFEMKYANGSWSKPAGPSFADTTADDYCPSFSADGRTLFFNSRRKAPIGYPEGRGNRIWTVDRTPDGWGTPIPFDTTVSKSREFGHSIAENGTLYFTSSFGGGTGSNILRAEKGKAGYTKPVLLPYSINSVGYEDGPYISPNEDFLIFESTRPEGIAGSHDLYISFKDKHKGWGMPKNMGPKINSAGMERFPRLSPDGKYLFFGSNRNQSAEKMGFDIYWIDAAVIDELRNTGIDKSVIEQTLGDNILSALDQRNISSSASLLKQWLSLYPGSLDATVVYSSTLRKQKNYSGAEQLLTNNSSTWDGNTGIILERVLAKFGLNKDKEAQELLGAYVIAEDQRRNNYTYLSDELFSMAKFNLSDEYLDKAMSIGPNGVIYYNRARAYALMGRKENAFQALGKAAFYGYNTRKNYEDAPDLQSLKSDVRWEVLMKGLK